MLKSSKISSGDQFKKEVLEGCGYAFDSASRKSGWRWSMKAESSDDNPPTEGEAIQDAWNHAGNFTQVVLSIPATTWDRMGVKEQAEMMNDAMSGS